MRGRRLPRAADRATVWFSGNMERKERSEPVRLFPYLSSLRPYLVRYRGELVKGFACILVQSAASLAIPWMLKRGIDGVQHGAEPGFLLRTAGAIVGLSVVSGVFLFLKRWILIGASRFVEFDLRNDFFRHLETLPVSFYHRNRTGDLMARATNDLNAVRDVVGPGIMYGLTTAATVVPAFIIMLRLDPVLSVATLAPLPFMVVLVSRLAGEVHRKSLRVQNQYGSLSNTAQENIAGIRVVQSYVQEESEKSWFGVMNREYLDRNLALIRYRSFFQSSIAFVLGLGSLLLLWVGGMRVIQDRVTLGELVAFMGYLAQLTWPFIAVGWVISMLQRGEAAMQRILEVWKEEPDIRDGAGALAVPRPNGNGATRGEIVLENVGFGYPGGPPVLSGISVRIPAGTALAIVGRTGTGKSTLVHLIPRLYDPSEGRILLDGHDVRDLPLADLRKSIAFVPQDTFLFSDTLENNIRFGREGASAEEVREAALLARLGPDLEGFRHGIATRVGERGVTLSGGQKQRTALARALLKNAPVLVLDDALSSVDKSTEQDLLETLRSQASERTMILIAHRISTVRLADQIIVLDGGRIAERGTHAELMARRGLYAELARRQALAEELDQTDVAR